MPFDVSTLLASVVVETTLPQLVGRHQPDHDMELFRSWAAPISAATSAHVTLPAITPTHVTLSTYKPNSKMKEQARLEELDDLGLDTKVRYWYPSSS